MNTTQVLVVDDSPVMRAVLTEMINRAPDLKVIAGVADAKSARSAIKTLKPDVLTLDVQLPEMNGLEFLGHLMRLNPMPVVMVSAFTQEGSDATLKALEMGAVDFMPKPVLRNAAALEIYAQHLIEKIRAAKEAQIGLKKEGFAQKKAKTYRFSPKALIAVGASTGGTEALKTFLEGMPQNCPPVLIVQHMPEHFTQSFAQRLDRLVLPKVVESQGMEMLSAGHVYLAPGNAHLFIPKGQNHTALSMQAPVLNQRPSVNVLFQSLEDKAQNVVAVLLTGMGKDGATGLLALRQKGARTIGQNQATSLVYGMPREAKLLGAVEAELPLEKIAPQALEWCALSTVNA